MRVLVAPASLKECLSAAEAARALAAGVRRAGAEAIEAPLADGGRGTVDCIASALKGSLRAARVTGPLGEPVQAQFWLAADGASAVFEMASASGLALVPKDRRDPMRATTRGTGELLRAAMDAGAEWIHMGIGDSATSDGGAGMAQALGYRLLDAEGREIGPGAGDLAHLARIDPSGRDARIGRVRVSVACDVTNPLTGPRGAAHVFGPQKGATPEQCQVIDRNLAHLAACMKRDLGADVANLPGAGAAGGLGAGAVAFLGAGLQSGAEWIMDTLGLERRLDEVDLVLTSEGRFDGQSLDGKAPMTLARRAAAHGKPCIVIAGSTGPGWEAALAEGVTSVFPLVQGNVTLAQAIAGAAALLADRAEEAVRGAKAPR